MLRTALLLLVAAFACEATATEADCMRERAAMIDTIRAHMRSAGDPARPQFISENVLDVMARMPRHLFVPERSCAVAYADRPASIGRGQTISQPYIVALMTQLADVASDHVALEIGTGSGYQAAILARLARKVCTVEIVPALADTAARLLKELALDNVSVKAGDGYHGWLDCGPFDAIVVTAALGHVPPPLIAQLKVGGRLVMPVGPVHAVQQLVVVEKSAPDRTTTRVVGLVRFVPFTRSPN